MNLLSDGQGITGVVDVNPPPVHGDRAFDLATLAFYVYDAGELRRPVWPGCPAWPAGRPGGPTWPTWCSGRSSGRSATIRLPRPRVTICASPG